MKSKELLPKLIEESNSEIRKKYPKNSIDMSLKETVQAENGQYVDVYHIIEICEEPYEKKQVRGIALADNCDLKKKEDFDHVKMCLVSQTIRKLGLNQKVT